MLFKICYIIKNFSAGNNKSEVKHIQEEWFIDLYQIAKFFDENLQNPMLLTVNDVHFTVGHESPLVTHFLKVLAEFPSSSKVVWHLFNYDVDVISQFLSLPFDGFITIDGRNSKTLEYLQVYLFKFYFHFRELNSMKTSWIEFKRK